MNQILVIDDDIELCELLSDYLDKEGLSVETVHDGKQGLERALSGDHGLLILDVMLPGMTGFEVLRNVRMISLIPVLMLTARGEDVDRIIGLEMGADDYLAKPFNPRELVARIHAIQRRTMTAGNDTPALLTRLELDDIILDPGSHTVKQDGKQVKITAVEFSLLHELLQRAGQVMGREELTQKVLGRKLETFDRSIDVHVSNLRKKLGHEVRGRERIKTIRSVGYLYAQASHGDNKEAGHA